MLLYYCYYIKIKKVLEIQSIMYLIKYVYIFYLYTDTIIQNYIKKSIVSKCLVSQVFDFIR